MTVQLITQDDICEGVEIKTTPAEFLVLNKALRQFKENQGNHLEDRKIAEQMTGTKLEFMERMKGCSCGCFVYRT